MNELTLPIRNLLGQRTRSALTILGIAFAVGGFVALKGLSLGLQNSFDQGVEEPGADIIVSQKDAFAVISSSVPELLGQTLSAIDGVEAVSGAILSITTADGDANIVIAGWPLRSFLWQHVCLIEGRIPHAEADWEVVLGELIARALHKRIGETIELQYQSYRIVGIASFATILNQNIAIVPLAGLQTLIARKNTVTLYQIRLRRPFDADRMLNVIKEIRSTAPDYSVSSTAEFTHNIRFFGIVRAFTSTVSIVVLAMAWLAIANTLLMAVNERTHEFGILASIGWTPARTLRMILTEGLVMSVAGGAVGLGLGITAMNAVSLTHIASGMLEPYLTTDLVLQAVVSVLVIGPLGALYPALRAIRLTPAEALRL